MPRRKREPLGPLVYLTKDAEENPLQASPVDSVDAFWPVADTLMEEQPHIKRIVLYEYKYGAFNFVNALSKPGFLHFTNDVPTEQELALLQRALKEQRS